MKKFLTQQINFAYAMIVMLILVVSVSSVSAGYALPGNLNDIDPIIHQGGGDQATDSLRIGTQPSPIGIFDVRGTTLEKIALFEATETGGFFSALYDAVFLDKLYISADTLSFIQDLNTQHNSLNTPYQQVNVDGDVLATNLINATGNAPVCVTRDGTLALCPDQTGTEGSCGLAAGHTYTSPPSTNLCSVGTASAVTTNASTYDWDCVGTASTTSCQANIAAVTNGLCGTAEQHASSTPPTTNLCAAGNASAVQTHSNVFNWWCYGINGGTTDSCSKVRSVSTDGVCKAYGGTYGAQPATDTATGCDAGIYNDLAPDDPDWIWECQGINGGTTELCEESKTSNAVNGDCNDFGTGVFTSQPANSGNGCNVGTYQDTTDDSTYWKWNCNGSNGGTNESCTELVAPVCTNYSGGPFGLDPSLGQGNGNCESGTFTDLSDTGSEYRWQCSLNGADVTCAEDIATGYWYVCGQVSTTDPMGNHKAEFTRGPLFEADGGDTYGFSNTESWAKDCNENLEPIPTSEIHVYDNSNPSSSYDPTSGYYYRHLCLEAEPHRCYCAGSGVGIYTC